MPISLQPVHALYYSAANTIGNWIVGAIADGGDKNKGVNAAKPPWPEYRSHRPYGFVSNSLEWFYSEASLELVEQVQLCVDQGFCVGLRLQYEKFDKALGHYKLDKEFKWPASCVGGLGQEGLRLLWSRRCGLMRNTACRARRGESLVEVAEEYRA